jgi:hypothetical protein
VTANPLRRPAHTSKLSTAAPGGVHKRRVHGDRPTGMSATRGICSNEGWKKQTLIDSPVRSEDLALGYKAHKNAWPSWLRESRPTGRPNESSRRRLCHSRVKWQGTDCPPVRLQCAPIVFPGGPERWRRLWRLARGATPIAPAHFPLIAARPAPKRMRVAEAARHFTNATGRCFECALAVESPRECRRPEGNINNLP